MSKIESLRPNSLGWRTLLAQLADNDDVEAVVCVVRVGGAWHTCWSNERHSGLAMAAMKLFADVTDWMHNSPDVPPPTLPPTTAA
jgi:hypothetical protein